MSGDGHASLGGAEAPADGACDAKEASAAEPECASQGRPSADTVLTDTNLAAVIATYADNNTRMALYNTCTATRSAVLQVASRVSVTLHLQASNGSTASQPTSAPACPHSPSLLQRLASIITQLWPGRNRRQPHCTLLDPLHAGAPGPVLPGISKRASAVRAALHRFNDLPIRVRVLEQPPAAATHSSRRSMSPAAERTESPTTSQITLLLSSMQPAAHTVQQLEVDTCLKLSGEDLAAVARMFPGLRSVWLTTEVLPVVAALSGLTQLQHLSVTATMRVHMHPDICRGLSKVLPSLHHLQLQCPGYAWPSDLRDMFNTKTPAHHLHTLQLLCIPYTAELVTLLSKCAPALHTLWMRDLPGGTVSRGTRWPVLKFDNLTNLQQVLYVRHEGSFVWKATPGVKCQCSVRSVQEAVALSRAVKRLEVMQAKDVLMIVSPSNAQRQAAELPRNLRVLQAMPALGTLCMSGWAAGGTGVLSHLRQLPDWNTLDMAHTKHWPASNLPVPLEQLPRSYQHVRLPAAVSLQQLLALVRQFGQLQPAWTGPLTIKVQDAAGCTIKDADVELINMGFKECKLDHIQVQLDLT